MLLSAGVILLALSIAQFQAAQALAPQARIGAIDLNSAFHLPPLKTDILTPQISTLGVVQRAQALGIDGTTATDAWQKGEKIFAQVETPVAGPALTFAGTQASVLNRLLERNLSVRVVSAVIEIDEPIRIARSGVSLDLGTATLRARQAIPYALRVERAENVIVRGGEFAAGDSAILVNAAAHVLILDSKIHDLSGSGIVLTHAARVIIRGNQISGMGAAPIVLHGGTNSSIVEQNEVVRNNGASNMAAGIVLSDRNVDLAAREEALYGPDGYWAIDEPMASRLNPPRNNVIALNDLAWNASSGVYVDGAVANVVALNTIEGNAKEGLCLDNGSAANVVTSNGIFQNGNRWGESDEVMAKDSILGGGRLQDGTPAEKVPGISVDNAIYNIIFTNNVAHNFGGGVKIVRTGYFNLIGVNTILDDNEGASAGFHFFGVELGATTLDAGSDGLDSTPSRGNIVFSNDIRGSHYSGIFFDAGSDLNDVFDNVIIDAQQWALESVDLMANSSLNNLTVIPSRNISAGLSTAVIESSQ
ncbi:MAG TPA: right-handed parallel beta-helix repeat-containing protein [Bryobacteraceae bacterium]|nr:right-handed parallel beta-helix repeat-containing protein [Bryobacteraceae bacterium]